MKVRDVMTHGAVTVHESSAFREIVDAMLAHDVSGVPVVDSRGHLLGVVTEADLLSKEAYEGRSRSRALAFVVSPIAHRKRFWTKAAGATARDVMTAPATTADPEEDLRAAARRMLERGLKRLPVVQDDRVIGVLSRHDVLRVFAESDERLRQAVQDALRPFIGWVPEYDVRASVSDGVVVLEGSVAYSSDARMIAAAVQRLEGVLAVHNRLTGRWERQSMPPIPWV